VAGALGILAEDEHFARVASPVALEDLDGRRLSRAVRPQEREDLARLDAEVEAVEDLTRPIRLAKVSNLDGAHGVGPRIAAPQL
jgi:hypothetical protein